jgi:hypothetical protein
MGAACSSFKEDLLGTKVTVLPAPAPAPNIQISEDSWSQSQKESSGETFEVDSLRPISAKTKSEGKTKNAYSFGVAFLLLETNCNLQPLSDTSLRKETQCANKHRGNERSLDTKHSAVECNDSDGNFVANTKEDSIMAPVHAIRSAVLTTGENEKFHLSFELQQTFLQALFFLYFTTILQQFML